VYSSVSTPCRMYSSDATLAWLGEVETCFSYGAVTIGRECEVKQELEVCARQDVWDEACRVEIAFDLRNSLSGIHDGGDSQSERDSKHRLHRYRRICVEERGAR
jgi:hypothetical protein